MKGLREKFRKNEGFTMVELLIVVAIIAILVAVSIPMMNSALEKSREAVDQANVRDAVALASMKYLTEPEKFDATNETTFYYCVDKNHQGYLSDQAADSASAATAKCTCSGAPGDTDYLIVGIKAPAEGKDNPTISLSWSIGADGKTAKVTTGAPTAPTGGAGGGGGG